MKTSNDFSLVYQPAIFIILELRDDFPPKKKKSIDDRTEADDRLTREQKK